MNDCLEINDDYNNPKISKIGNLNQSFVKRSTNHFKDAKIRKEIVLKK